MPSEQTGGTMVDGVEGNEGKYAGNIFFRVSKVICSQATQIQDPAHVLLSFNQRGDNAERRSVQGGSGDRRELAKMRSVA